jgi:hypothetical protein
LGLDVIEWVMMQTNKADKIKRSKMGIRRGREGELVEVQSLGVRVGVETDARGYESLLQNLSWHKE